MNNQLITQHQHICGEVQQLVSATHWSNSPTAAAPHSNTVQIMVNDCGTETLVETGLG